MEAPQPGHFWKIPFLWEQGCATPSPSIRLSFAGVHLTSLEAAVADVMASSTDESDQAAVAELGATGAARELLGVDESYFQWEPSWWRLAKDGSGETVGFVLPVRLRQEQHWQDGMPQGSIYYMGVLPAHRGNFYARELLDEATRMLLQHGCWRIFCDLSATNEPMLKAFRQAGFNERNPWQRRIR